MRRKSEFRRLGLRLRTEIFALPCVREYSSPFLIVLSEPLGSISAACLLGVVVLLPKLEFEDIRVTSSIRTSSKNVLLPRKRSAYGKNKKNLLLELSQLYWRIEELFQKKNRFIVPEVLLQNIS